MMKFDINGPVAKKVLGIGTAIVMGAITVVSTLADQKQAAEFENLKKIVDELQNK